jgi:DNA-binding LacI/PurR family transcriptional regulator
MLQEQHVPVVSLEPIEGAPVDCVTVDRRHGAYIATRHLLERGHRRIALIHGPPSYPVVRQRMQGYEDALRESGVPMDPGLFVERRERRYRGGYEAMQRLLQRTPLPTALFCNDDEMAIGAMRAAREAGLRVPEDLAIVGFGDLEAAAYATPPLTTVAQPVAEIARRAVELLFERVGNPGDGRGPQVMRLKPLLVVRESCGGPGNADANDGSQGGYPP